MCVYAHDASGRLCFFGKKTKQCHARHVVPSFMTLPPPLCRHAGRDVMKQQCRDGAFGGMLSFQVAGGEHAAVSVAGATTLFKRATSLGGTESLIEHRASIEDDASTTPTDLLRLSVGLEDKEELAKDLDAALNCVS